MGRRGRELEEGGKFRGKDPSVFILISKQKGSFGNSIHISMRRERREEVRIFHKLEKKKEGYPFHPVGGEREDAWT